MKLAAPPRPGVAATARDERPIRAPWGRRHTIWVVAGLLTLVLVPVSLQQTGVNLAALSGSVDALRGLLARMVPLDFREAERYGWALLVTVLMVVAGTAMAVVFSIPLAFLAARNTTTGRTAYAVSRAVIVFTRAVPDVIWAVLFVQAVGIGPLAGVLAMGLYSTGMIAKFYSDQIEVVRPGPLEAMRAAGASRLQVLASAVLPQVLAGWIAIALYRIDTNMRYSVILGYVGAGGIGLELQRVQGQLVYPRVLAIVALIFVLIAAVEQLSGAARRALAGEVGENPFRHQWRRSLALLLPRREGAVQRRETRPSQLLEQGDATVREPWTAVRRRKVALGAGSVAVLLASIVHLGVDPVRVARGLASLGPVFAAMVPPDFVSRWDTVMTQLLETFWIAIAATALGLVLSVPIALLGARNATPHPIVRRLARLGMLAARGVPELILAILFVVAFGLGPFAGVIALAIGAIGFTGKLFADAIEDLPNEALVALRATGASWSQRTASGMWPQALPGLLSIGLYTLDQNLRNATILGIVGAGGVGATLTATITFREYDRTAAIILVIFAVVYAFERLSGWLRRELA